MLRRLAGLGTFQWRRGGGTGTSIRDVSGEFNGAVELLPGSKARGVDAMNEVAQGAAAQLAQAGVGEIGLLAQGEKHLTQMGFVVVVGKDVLGRVSKHATRDHPHTPPATTRSRSRA